MIPAQFEYTAPETLGGALSALAAGGEAKLLAGGHSLIPTMKLRLAQPDKLVDLANIPELQFIAETDGVIRVGGDDDALPSRVVGAAGGEMSVAGEVGREHWGCAGPKSRNDWRKRCPRGPGGGLSRGVAGARGKGEVGFRRRRAGCRLRRVPGGRDDDGNRAG